MPVALAIAGSAIVGAGASVYSSNKAANAAKDAANRNNKLQQQQYAENKANLDPYMQRGNVAGGALNDLLGIGGDPAKAQAAYQNYLNSTGYTTQLQAGTDALTSQRAALGGLYSGKTMKALDQYGQNLGAGYFSNYLNMLGNQQGVGLSGANALAGVGTNYANAVSANNNSAASAQGNAYLAGGNALANLGSTLASSYAAYKGGAFGGGSGFAPVNTGGYDPAGYGAASSPYVKW